MNDRIWHHKHVTITNKNAFSHDIKEKKFLRYAHSVKQLWLYLEGVTKDRPEALDLISLKQIRGYAQKSFYIWMPIEKDLIPSKLSMQLVGIVSIFEQL